jgi:AcrR family transcriptional regulator
MSKTDRKAVLLQALTDHVLVEGLGPASLRPLAKAVGTSDRMLLYYFPDKPALIAAVLEEVAGRMMAMLQFQSSADPVQFAALQARLMPLLRDPALWPYMQLWLEMAALAARGDETCARVGGAIARGFVDWLESQLAIEGKRERRAAAVSLLAGIEGAVLLTSLGLGDEVAAL